MKSTLRELPLYDFQADLENLSVEVAQLFERHLQLPGVDQFKVYLHIELPQMGTVFEIFTH